MAHLNELPATIRWANGCLNAISNLASRAQQGGMLCFGCKEWRETLGHGVAQGEEP